MCQRLVETVEHKCRHRIDSSGTVRELDGCNNCGIITTLAYVEEWLEKVSS